MIVRTTAGINCGPQDSNLQPRDSRALAFPRGLDYLILLSAADATTLHSRSFVQGHDDRSKEEAGRSRRGLLLGLTPLVSEPSWPPEPDQARLRIAVPEAPPPLTRREAPGLGSPQFTRFALEGYPSAPPFSDESPALPLS
jgi:hypothetical protein